MCRPAAPHRNWSLRMASPERRAHPARSPVLLPTPPTTSRLWCRTARGQWTELGPASPLRGRSPLGTPAGGRRGGESTLGLLTPPPAQLAPETAAGDAAARWGASPAGSWGRCANGRRMGKLPDRVALPEPRVLTGVQLRPHRHGTSSVLSEDFDARQPVGATTGVAPVRGRRSLVIRSPPTAARAPVLTALV
jgi:hypothetical protein